MINWKVKTNRPWQSSFCNGLWCLKPYLTKTYWQTQTHKHVNICIYVFLKSSQIFISDSAVFDGDVDLVEAVPHVWMEESWRLCSLALSRRYSILVVVLSSSGGSILSGVGGVVGAKDRLLSRIAAAVTAAAAALTAVVVTGGVGTGKGVRTGTRVVVSDESWGVRVVRAGSRLLKDRRLGVDWSRELKWRERLELDMSDAQTGILSSKIWIFKS